MTTHKGNSEVSSNDRTLHRFRLPKSLWDWIEKSYVLLALAGMVFTVLAVSADDSFRAKTFLVAILALLILMSLLSLAEAWMNGEKAKYAETVEYIHQCLHSIRDLNVYLLAQLANPKDDANSIKRRIRHDLTTVLDRLTLAISLVSGVRVKVRLTQTVPVENRLRIEVLARDSASRTQWKHQDNVQIDHWLDENTSMRKVAVQEEVSYYYNPSVHRSGDYESSFFKNFPLDRKYKSCMVFPIRGRGAEDEKHQYCGFLHVESMSQKAMNTRYDVDMGASIADSLYLVLSNYATLCRKGK